MWKGHVSLTNGPLNKAISRFVDVEEESEDTNGIRSNRRRDFQD